MPVAALATGRRSVSRHSARKGDEKRTGRVTIPTDLDAVPETLALMQRWGADAIRDCDGTEFPAQLRDTGA